MNRLPILIALAVLPACATFFKESVSLQEVDDLVGRVERVHVECEISRTRVGTTLAQLESLVAPDTGGDLMADYAEYVSSVEASEKRASTLRTAIADMRAAAEPFFERWEADLDEYTSVSMRERSLGRLAETRARYQAVTVVVGPASEGYDSINGTLRDLALFLSRDFNPSSVQQVEDELDSLRERVAELDGQLQACMDAAREYVELAALPARVEATQEATGARREG